jgi:hypothetical protein
MFDETWSTGGVVSITIALFTPSEPVVPGAGSVRLAGLLAALLIVPPFSVSAVLEASSSGFAF